MPSAWECCVSSSSAGSAAGAMAGHARKTRAGRTPQRHCTVVDIPDRSWNSFHPLHGRRQAFRILRCRQEFGTGEASTEITRGLTSLGPEAADPQEIAGHVGSHRGIGNRLHFIRDVTCDGDRCRTHAGHAPQRLAAICSIAIPLIRLDGRFECIPLAGHRRRLMPS